MPENEPAWDKKIARRIRLSIKKRLGFNVDAGMHVRGSEQGFRARVSFELGLGHDPRDKTDLERYGPALENPAKFKALQWGIPESHPNFGAILLTMETYPKMELSEIKKLHNIAESEIRSNPGRRLTQRDVQEKENHGLP